MGSTFGGGSGKEYLLLTASVQWRGSKSRYGVVFFQEHEDVRRFLLPPPTEPVFSLSQFKSPFDQIPLGRREVSLSSTCKATVWASR